MTARDKMRLKWIGGTFVVSVLFSGGDMLWVGLILMGFSVGGICEGYIRDNVPEEKKV